MASEMYPHLLDLIGKSSLAYPEKPLLTGIVQLTPRYISVCFEGVKRIALISSVSFSTAKRGIKRLEALELIAVETGSRDARRVVNEELILRLGSVLDGDPLFLDTPRASTLRKLREIQARSARFLDDPPCSIKKAPAPSEAPSEATPAQLAEGVPSDLTAPAISNKAEALEHLINVAARLDDDYECSARDDGAPLAPQVEPAPIAAPVDAALEAAPVPQVDAVGPSTSPGPAPVAQDGELFPSEAPAPVVAPERPKTAAQIRREQAVDVVLYWCDWDTALKLAREKGGNSPSSEARKRNMSTDEGKARIKAVERRLRDGFTVEEIKSAIRGIFNTPHNIGGNDRGGIYTSLQLICKTGGNFETYTNNDPGECDPRALSLDDLRLSKVRAEMARGDFRNFASNISLLRGGEPPKPVEIDF